MNLKNKNLFKKCFFLAFLIIIITVVFSIIVKYHVEGEITLPYSLERILIISRIDSKNNEDPEHMWNISLTENNNIFINFKKNQKNSDETIKEIKIDNFQITEKPQLGEIAIYRPTGDLNNLYEFSEQNYLDSNLTYTGAQVDTLKTLEIGNSGGMIGFRVSLENLGNYISDTDEEIVYDGNLITKANINENDIKFSISFDILITLNSNISFKGTATLDLPNKDIVSNPESYLEITNFDDIVFKRLED